MFFDSATSFMLIRSVQVDMTVLEALEVDQKCDFANWIVPGKKLYHLLKLHFLLYNCTDFNT
ncbi:hypothetical protein [Clostridium sp.]|uniref:hypothetical protein n=1 Tax=Clostridium sp. TaxID=1506 RepID=UPI001A50F63C|nr:hypothetical protein [Clostridium sp.]MBK5234470.1 hypothetical protein [Clostridium sp.]